MEVRSRQYVRKRKKIVESFDVIIEINFFKLKERYQSERFYKEVMWKNKEKLYLDIFRGGNINRKQKNKENI